MTKSKRSNLFWIFLNNFNSHDPWLAISTGQHTFILNNGFIDYILNSRQVKYEMSVKSKIFLFPVMRKNPRIVRQLPDKGFFKAAENKKNPGYSGG